MSAAVAVAGVAGLTATAIALSAQTTTHASGRISTPVASATRVRAASTVSPRRTTAANPSATPSASHTTAAPAKPESPAKPKPAAKSKPKSTAKSKPAKANLDTSYQKAPAKTVWYTVRSGDSLSTISGRVYGHANDWPVLYYANKSSISSADVISIGQRLRVPPLPAKIPAPPATETVRSSSSSGSSAASSTVSSTASEASGSVNASDYSGFQACVISRESGGNSQVMNSSGHYGLYQFSESTWVAYGGSAADFGHASVAEQNQVFDNAMAAGGESNWAPYDGC